MAKKGAKKAKQKRQARQQQRGAGRGQAVGKNNNKKATAAADETGGTIELAISAFEQIFLDETRKKPAPMTPVSDVLATSASSTKLGRQPSGLPNLINTCYINSVIQVLSQTYILRQQMLERLAADSDGSVHQLISTFLKLMEDIFSMRCANPRPLLKLFRDEHSQLNNHKQQDADEFFYSFLESLSKFEADRQKEAAALSDKQPSTLANRAHTVFEAIFTGLRLNCTKCTTCGFCSFALEPFTSLHLTLAGLKATTSASTFANIEKIKKYPNNKPAASTPPPPKGKKAKKQAKAAAAAAAAAKDEDDEDEDVEDSLDPPEDDDDDDCRKLTPSERKEKRAQKKALKKEARLMAKEEAQIAAAAAAARAKHEVTEAAAAVGGDDLKLKQKIETMMSFVDDSKDDVLSIEEEGQLPLDSGCEADAALAAAAASDDNDSQKNNNNSKFILPPIPRSSPLPVTFETYRTRESFLISPYHRPNYVSGLKWTDATVAADNVLSAGPPFCPKATTAPCTAKAVTALLTGAAITTNTTATDSDSSSQEHQPPTSPSSGFASEEGAASSDDAESNASDTAAAAATTTPATPLPSPEILTIDAEYRKRFYAAATQKLDPHTDVVDNRQLGALLDFFVQPEVLDGGNMYACPSCNKGRNIDGSDGGKKKETAIKTIALHSTLIAIPPPILAIQLKRFKHSGLGYLTGEKIETPITFPDRLNLSPYTSRIYEAFAKLYEPDVNLEDVGGGLLEYQLYGVVAHKGSLNFGHYWAYVAMQPEHFANPKERLGRFLHLKPFVGNLEQLISECYKLEMEAAEDDQDQAIRDKDNNSAEAADTRQWFDVSDSIVKRTTLAAVLGDTKAPYVLFYERLH